MRLEEGAISLGESAISPGRTRHHREDALTLINTYLIDYQHFQNWRGNSVHFKFALLSCSQYKKKRNYHFSLVFICMKIFFYRFVPEIVKKS